MGKVYDADSFLEYVNNDKDTHKDKYKTQKGETSKKKGFMEVELMVTKCDNRRPTDRVNIEQSASGRLEGRVLQKGAERLRLMKGSLD